MAVKRSLQRLGAALLLGACLAAPPRVAAGAELSGMPPDVSEETRSGAPLPAPAAEPTPEPELVPPVPIGSIEVPWPEGVAPPATPIEVEVALLIDESGAVTEVRLVRGAGTPWDEAVLAACRAFRFQPARWNGVPAAVEVPFVQRFTAPEPPPDEEGEEEAVLDAAIEGEVIEMGTRRIVPGAAIVATVGDRPYRAESDAAGRFSLRLPAGEAQVEVEMPGYKRFLVAETLPAGESLRVRYLVERISYNPFEQLVIGKATRQEVTRTTLRDRELRRVPGTFGDPFRVVSTMPGVGQMFSLLDYPIIRGASPGSSGILLDGDRIPQLFHFLAGPAVIHPEFLDRIDFYPGAFPIEYGGYTGGIVDGITRAGAPDERRLEIGADLLNTSLFVRQPLGSSVTGTIAGRYGYPGMLLSAFSEDVYASYWDYQGRLDGRTAGGRWTIFAFGSFDEFGEVHSDGSAEANLQSLFHRLSLLWHQGDDASFDRYELGLGTDSILTGEDEGDEDLLDPSGGTTTQSVTTWSLHPRASWRRPLTENLSLHGGLGLQYRTTTSNFVITDDGDAISPSDWLVQAGAFVQLPWWLTDDFLLTPAFRLDLWETESASRGSVDPRINFRWRVEQNEAAQLWLKGGVGIFHQPPRSPVPIPGLTELLLEEGLPAALQTTVGSELDLASGYFFDVQTYFNYMDPIFLDLETNGAVGENADAYADAYRRGLTGRSYGVEILLRRRQVGDLFGWISYTLSRSERLAPDGWKAFDFDRTHMLQLVAGMRLPRDWELGARFQAVSGRPVSPWGEAVERADTFTRFDLRIDKRVVYRSWMLDFYVELINTMISREQVAEGSDSAVPYIFPTVGFRAVL